MSFISEIVTDKALISFDTSSPPTIESINGENYFRIKGTIDNYQDLVDAHGQFIRFENYNFQDFIDTGSANKSLVFNADPINNNVLGENFDFSIKIPDYLPNGNYAHESFYVVFNNQWVSADLSNYSFNIYSSSDLISSGINVDLYPEKNITELFDIYLGAQLKATGDFATISGQNLVDSVGYMVADHKGNTFIHGINPTSKQMSNNGWEKLVRGTEADLEGIFAYNGNYFVDQSESFSTAEQLAVFTTT